MNSNRSPHRSKTASPSPAAHRPPTLGPGSPALGGRKKTQKKPEDAPGLLVHGARDDFMAILRERNQVEMEAALPRKAPKPFRTHGVQDIGELTKLLQVSSEKRTDTDLVLIAEQIRHTGIFEKLFISHIQEGALCRILTFRKFSTKGATVVHEGQSKGFFHLVLEGTLVVLASRSAALQAKEANLAKNSKSLHERYVMVINIIDAVGIAAADKTGASDPFVTVTVGLQEDKTTVKKETLNPIWDETLRIFNVDPQAERIEIAVWDHDSWGDPDFLGIVCVPVKPLMDELHEVQQFGMRLQEDPRFQAAADEAGVDYEISGSISFHAQMTTEAVLSQIQQMEDDKEKAGKDKVYFTAGDAFGAEQVLDDHGKAPNSVIVEQPTIVLRVGAQDYAQHIFPLMAHEVESKKEFFAELSVFSQLSEEELLHMCKYFRISNYRPGQLIALEGAEREEVVFILSGEVSAVVDVPGAGPLEVKTGASGIWRPEDQVKRKHFAGVYVCDSAPSNECLHLSARTIVKYPLCTSCPDV